MTDSGPSEVAADGYAEALAELQKILDALEEPDVNVDALAGYVDRAAELLRFCRERLLSAETQVTEIVAGLEQITGDDEAAPAADGAAADPD
ncbi:MAG: exodeoxyribonuclease VII small subunit [Acidimicrobiia bacterium]|nr:exodeoxyribonuclease VII small subunit [Acidimicrobiia bacterium]MYB24785.1 exodeoxyribonuclease VII small subunit [Acidimicrobiia bacterium]MYE67674.1 exodeoxyribonuclease VII small subunit [Acidimicrobiia bacterium]MYJ13492.1 exodeoxyribonuclease VII small subunit [Acidimicrobiia bacterium]